MNRSSIYNNSLKFPVIVFQWKRNVEAFRFTRRITQEETWTTKELQNILVTKISSACINHDAKASYKKIESNDPATLETEEFGRLIYRRIDQSN